jgi:undecaprenyl-diphosphatase
VAVVSIWEAILLGVIEGITEFLPISSTGHLTIAEKFLGYSIDNPDITAFTAIIQSGAVLATLLYFRRDLWRLGSAWMRGLSDARERGTVDYRLAWAVLIGSIPIGIVGLLFQDQIETVLRSLWFVGSSLIIWGMVLWVADRSAKQMRHEGDVTWRDTLVIGLVQCLALIPGISRSGATISAGLFRGLDRVTVTRLSFFLSIPALMAAAVLQTVTKFDDITHGVGWAATLTGTVVSFVVAYMAVAWLLKFIAGHTYTPFIVYRIVLGSLVLMLVGTGFLPAT